MAFTVGVAGASYASVEYADAYAADRGATDWTGASALKQGALVRATDYIKAMFAARFDPALFATGLPDSLLRATVEYARTELKTPGGLAPAPAVDASGYSVVMTKRKLGPLERNFAVVGAGEGQRPATRRSFPVPDALIAGLLLPAQGATRVVR